jgi:hypothetical protein
MPLEGLIVTILRWVDEPLKAPRGDQRLRRRGLAPRWADSAVIPRAGR